MASHSTNVSGAMAWSGSPPGGSSISASTRPSRCGWIWLWLAGLARSCATPILSPTAPSMRRCAVSSSAAVDGLQLVFDRSIVTSVQPRSLITQMRDAVADCDDGSSEDGMMLLSMPHDIPEVTFPEVREMRDEDTPVVISRRLTPANRPLQLLEAGRLGASATEHLPSRPAVPDLCIASSSLLSALDPLPLDRLSRHTVEEIRLWPVADRHAILAVANRDVRVARQNLAELMVYVDDHAAHLANCASANDDSLTLMSAELIPRLEGGIRAVLDEAANL